jgi:8-hydroxy-5-deazaflavin:NADPH oxidoreductase
MTTIGLIGAGHIGSQVARLAIAHDNNVVISNSRGPETLADLVKVRVSPIVITQSAPS